MRTLPAASRLAGALVLALGRIHAQLIDARSDHHLWAEQYDRDVLALVDSLNREGVALVELGREQLLDLESQTADDSES